MGLFGNLFNKKKDLSFSASEELMAEDIFWKIIRSSHRKAGGDFSTQQEVLEEKLKEISPQELILFDNRFRQLRGNANDWKLWGAIYIVHGGCDDDSFNDFREWVIAQGREFYYELLKDPESLMNAPRSMVDVEWEGMGYIATAVFREMTAQEMPAEYKENMQVKGTPWREQGDDLRNMFPKMWAKVHPANADTPMHIDREPAPGI